MASSIWLPILLGFSNLQLGHATPLDVQTITRNAPGITTAETHAAIANSLYAVSMKRDVNNTFSTSFDKSWLDAPLFSMSGSGSSGDLDTEASVEISCKTCYIKGLAVAELVIEGDRNISQIISDTTSNVEAEIKQLVNQTEDAVDQYYHKAVESVGGFTAWAEETMQNMEDGIDLADFLPPNLTVSFNEVDLSPIPDATLSFRFEDLDLYLELDTLLNVSAEYTIPLYHSNTPVGISVPGLDLGLLFTLDLILAIDGFLDMTSGLHLKIDDHVALNIALLGNNVSDIDFRGGHFEFLPVTVQSAGAAFTATLRVGARAAIEVLEGVSLHELLNLTDLSIMNYSIPDYKFGGGIEVGVYANVAEFKTEVTAKDAADADCELEVAQEYSLVLGATAGAQVTIGTVAYGPAVDATTAIFTTTMATACITKTSATVTSTTTMASATVTSMTTTGVAMKRQDSSDASPSTKVLSTETVLTAMQCPPTVTGQCPVSEQNTVRTTTMLTTTLTGFEEDLSSATFPTPTVTAIPFGTQAKSISATSGSPKPYTATAIPTGVVDQAVEAVREREKIAIGVGVGVGVPLLTALLATIFFYLRRKKYSSVSMTDIRASSSRPVVKRFASSFSSFSSRGKPDVREVERLSYTGT